VIKKLRGTVKMKAIALCTISALSTSGVFAQNPAPEQGPQNCYMEVQNVSSTLEIQRNWETSWGSYDRDHFGRLILKIRLGTVGRTGGPMKVQWFWIGRKLNDIGKLIVYGKGEKMVVVPAKYFVECYAAAPILKSHVLNLAAAENVTCPARSTTAGSCARATLTDVYWLRKHHLKRC
jgi:hypothetical protein